MCVAKTGPIKRRLRLHFGCPAVSRAMSRQAERCQKHGRGDGFVIPGNNHGCFGGTHFWHSWVLDERWSHNSSPFFLFWVGRNQKVGCFIQIDWSHQVRLRRSELDGRQLDIVASQARRLVSQYLILPPKHATIWMMMTRDYHWHQ